MYPYDKDTLGFPQALEIMENLENQEKSSMHGKIMDFEKIMNNHGKIMDFFKSILTKPPVARKIAVRHTKLVCLTASFLATQEVSSFNYFKMHAWSTSMAI